MKNIVVCMMSVALVFALTGCGKGPKQEAKDANAVPNVQIQGPNGTVSVGPQLPANLPKYVEIYPGAEVTAVVSGVNEKNVAGMITVKTKAPLAEVADFYKKSLAKSGFKVKGEFATAEVQTLSAVNGDVEYSVAITKSDNNETTIMITYK
jgi:hypothetical protein